MKPTMLNAIAATFCGLLLALTLAANAGTTHYRWYDDRGNPIHSDRPPPQGVDYEVIETGSTLVRKVDGGTGAVPKENTPRVGNEFEQIDTDPQKTDKSPEYCRRARENLEALNTASRIRLTNDKGEPQFLSDEERDIQKQKAQDVIAVHCD